MDREEEWIRAHVEPTGSKEVVRERVWATTWRLPTSEGVVWFKASAPTHRFEAELVPLLAAGWPDLLPRVVAEDAERGWLLLSDAGTPFETLGNPPELWLKLLPAYGELQRDATVPDTVPDRTLGRWPELYDDLLNSELPLTTSEVAQLRQFATRFAELCEELAAYGMPAADARRSSGRAFGNVTRARVRVRLFPLLDPMWVSEEAALAASSALAVDTAERLLDRDLEASDDAGVAASRE